MPRQVVIGMLVERFEMGKTEERCAEQCTQADLPNRAESQNYGGNRMLVRSIDGVRQASLAQALGHSLTILP